MTERFSLEIPANDCANGIYYTYKDEVLATGGTIDLDPVKPCILKAAQWLTNPYGKPGLMLNGYCGNGKTTLAQAIKRLVRFVTEKELGYSKAKQMRFFTAKQIVRRLQCDAKLYQKLFTEEMLIIDDLGEEPKEVMIYGSIETPLIDLISERYAKRLLTIITTNLQTPQLKRIYGERIYDRFCEMLTCITFCNDSFRQKMADSQAETVEVLPQW
ncbi:MAG: ATP-binding protein [Prevotella sp.]|nr:ATP-binding protein [Prevotella sp.]MCM1074603.1 ATP-binding protein [Ruminococcus sp.]